MELLAPAGDISRLKTAFYFGADAVYLGGKEFGLRARSGNFTNGEILEAIRFARGINKKVYAAVNIFAKNGDFDAIKKYAKFLQTAGVDAVIVSDLGVLKIFRENTDLEIHISTQANICNKYTAEEYVNLGASRVILARELPIADIAEICKHLKNRADVEVFVHGAMCVSYSGRCLLSDYMTGRESNRGDCSQPCRYRYALQEEKRPGEFYPIEEDGRGTYIMNSRDLCLIRRIRELSDAGVASLKIEGRMKSEYYVGGVVNAYRRALDGLQFDYIAELEKTAHRPFTAGFTFGDKDTQFTASAAPQQTHKIAAVVVSASAARTDTYTVKQKNKFTAGEELEILSPSDTWNKTFTVDASSNIPEQTVEIHCPYPLRPNDILRKKVHSQC